MPYDLKDYVEVHERVEKFYDRYPEGSIQSFITHRPTGDWPFIEVQSFAYRNPEDPRPGIGNSAEPFPGKTPYTKDSELENAETSAIGRALAALGFETKRSMASANEVRSRQSSEVGEVAAGEGEGTGGEPSPASDPFADPVFQSGPKQGQSYSRVAADDPAYLQSIIDQGQVTGARLNAARHWLSKVQASV
jgi:hypothetical protein